MNGPNERLRQAMTAAGHSIETLAEAAGYHPKHVGRWLSQGVIPRRTGARTEVAALLDVDESEIWPVHRLGRAGIEIVEVWAHRADVPREAWWDLIDGADHQIDLLAYAMLFLPEDHPRLIPTLAEKAEVGVKVRILLADPDCAQVAARGAEEGCVPLADRIRYSLAYFAPVADVEGIEVRLHDTPLYCSVFRADDQAFTTPHFYGLPGPLAPLYHLRRRTDPGLFTSAAGHVDRVWEVATPWPEPTTTTTPTPHPQTA